MTKIIALLKKKEVFLPAIAIVLALSYAMFFKPNPWVRVNINKLQASSSESALSIEAPGEVDGVGQKFKVTIKLDTMGNSVNAAQSYLQFDPKVLEIVSSNTEKSFCKFYPENNYSNDKGLVKLSCGSPYPGFRGKNILQELEFTAKAIQSTSLKITDNSMILANDGKGTNLIKEYPVANIKIKAGL